MQKRWKLALAGVAGTLVAAATAFQLTRNGYEEPPYDALLDEGDFEVRHYRSRVVAQTVVSGDEDDVTNEGFRRLAGYIFGGNAGDDSIAMTTPVERAPEGTRIDMTTPVESSPADGGWVITFTMPSEHSLETLPTPDDERVELRELPSRTVAVLRFSGRVDATSRRQRTEELLRLAREKGYEPTGEPTLAQYDPPWVLGIFRRNEIQVPVRSNG